MQGKRVFPSVLITTDKLLGTEEHPLDSHHKSMIGPVYEGKASAHRQGPFALVSVASKLLTLWWLHA